MLEKIRQASGTWYFKAFLALLAVCFVTLWGVGDMMMRPFRTSIQTIATVGGAKVSYSDLQEGIEREKKRLQRMLGKELTPQFMAELGIYPRVLQQLIQNILLDLEADRLDLIITDETIRALIQGNPSFANKSNRKFDRTLFQKYLRSIAYSETQYLKILRDQLRRTQLIEGLIEGIIAPSSMVESLFKWEKEKRDVEYVTIYADSINKIAPASKNDLRALYEKSPNFFIDPEYRDITVLTFGPDDMGVKITNDQIKKAFESQHEGQILKNVQDQIVKDLKRYHSSEGLYRLSTKIEDALSGGSTLEEISKDMKLKLMHWKDVDANGILKSSSKTLTSPLEIHIIRESFRKNEGELSALNESDSGEYFIVRVNSVLQSQQQPFEKVEKKAKELWGKTKRLEVALNNAKKLVKKVNQGKKSSLKWGSHTLKRRGLDPKYNLELPHDLVKKIFAINSGQAAFAPTTTKPGFMVVRVKKIAPGTTRGKEKELELFKVKVRQILVNDILSKYLDTLSQRYRVEYNKKALQELKDYFQG